LDFDSHEIKTAVRELKKIDIQLACLALLTRQGVKPLSRWEKPLDDHGLRFLQQMGLLARQIRRTVKTGKVVSETIFSVSAGYIELYKERFGGTPIDKSAATVRFEGFLFGYPSCCVEQFIRNPYARNNLNPEVQKILFHWACRDCKVTPALLPGYRRVYEYVEKC